MMNSLTGGIFSFAILLTLTAILAYSLDGVKVYMAVGLRMQVLGFASLLAS